ncbi:hypothetical protein Zm00014a_014622 [Zea mays]|uniref:Uncharacterized protein n=1 Tax=Zea mays TaxID=4577 RepID=A0A3L6GB19_MAIZE|nr:hypothetical protein Zm00014a_014622 [Zea mays]
MAGRLRIGIGSGGAPAAAISGAEAGICPRALCGR